MIPNEQYTETERLYELGAQTARLFRPSGEVISKRIRSELDEAMKGVATAHDTVRRRFGRAASVPAACEWLLDNRYVAVREERCVKRAFSGKEKLRSCDDGAMLLLLCRRLVSAGAGKVTPERCAEFLRGFQSVTVLTGQELRLFPDALRHALLLRLSAVCTALLGSSEPDEFSSEIAAVFGSLNTVSGSDMRALCESVDLTEQTLSKDPAGVYRRMDEKSRSYYRERLHRLAKSSGVGEYELAQRLISEAKERNEHIGVLLFAGKRPRSGALYITANVVATLFLAVLCGFLAHSAAAAFLLLLPISELTKSLLDHIILLCVEPAFLPRLDLSEGVPDEGRSVCVISSLLTSPESAEALVRRLEEISLSNRSCGKNLSFGILADLREAGSAVTDADAAILSAAAERISALNEKYCGGFFLFTRPRRETPDGGFSGFERKRGAILALARLLCGEKTDLRAAVGDPERLADTHYIISLDADTVPAPDSLSELIGAMLHPLNAPVLDTELCRISSGFGIIHPRIGTELKSVYSNDFARIFAGVGGSEPYSALCGEVYMDLFSNGGFCGKGIMDARALLCCSEAHIPDGEVLSHDALEGAYLHGAYMSDVEFCDSFPPTPLSYFRRSHRWIRGDWQNAPWIFSRTAGLSDVDRFRLFDSLRRSLVAPMIFAALFLGLCLGAPGMSLAAWAALLALACGLLISLTDAIGDRRRRTRYHSSLLYGVGLALLRTFIRLWLLPYEAFVSLSAILTSLWRMLISGKKLLQWETAAQSAGKKSSPLSCFASMWFSVAAGLALILISDGIFAKAAGLMWMLSPLCVYALSLPARSAARISDKDKKYLLGLSKEIWSYFKTFCTAEDNFLPPDNYQEQPPVGLAHRTSPTNIGLALCSALCASDLGIDGGRGIELIVNMLGTLERMPKYGGHFYNWYDTRTLRPLSPKYVSAVDCGNLFACLLAVKNGLCEHRFFDAAKRVEALMRPMDFSVFYDPVRRLMRIGIDAASDLPSPGHYDLMASEARLTSYIAVAKGDVPKKHWESLSRAMQSYRGYTGMASWTGTMFEYLMPELFLPLFENSLLYETAKYCVFVQKHRRSPNGLWGISESAFFSLDPALNYRYKAHGCKHLALKRGQERELVISPYSAFLALGVEPTAAVRDLRLMQRRNLKGRFGFIEALDFTPSRCRSESGERVACYMAHHLGMSLIAAANLISDDIVVRRTMQEPYMAAYSSLLKEKLPIEPQVLELNTREPEEPHAEKPRRYKLRGEETDFYSPHCCLLTNGAYNIMLTESGISSAACRSIQIYTTPAKPLGEGHGLEIMLRYKNKELSLLPEPNREYGAMLWELGESSCSYGIVTDALRCRCSAALSGTRNGEMRFVELQAKEDLGKLELELSFEPVLAMYQDYVNHPAYWRLGILAEEEGGCLMLRRLPRGAVGELWLCISCNRTVRFSADRHGGTGALSSPLVRVRHSGVLRSGQRLSMRFCICLADTKESAFEGAQHMLATGPSEYGSMVSAYASVLNLGERQVAKAMDDVFALHFRLRADAPFDAKERLWQYGISGDLPIILCPMGKERHEVSELVRRFCLLLSCGMQAELVFISDEGGDYYRPVYSAVRDTLGVNGLDALLGSPGGIRILPPAAEDDIRSCACIVVGEERQLRESGREYLLAPKCSRSPSAVPEYGYAEDGSFTFYVNQALPPRAWTHMLTNGHFGYIAADNGCGNMWYENAREMRISPWLCDPLGRHPVETLEYLCDGKRISFFASEDGIPCRISYGAGFARWEKAASDFGLRCTAFVPPELDARVIIAELCGRDYGSIAWTCELQLGSDYGDKSAVSTSYVNSLFRAESPRSPYPVRFIASASRGSERHRLDLGSLQCSTEDGSLHSLAPVFSAVYPAAGALVIVCGCCSEEELLALCKPDAAFKALEDCRRHWSELLSVFRMESGNNPLDRYMNGWGLYQTYACRMLGRCSIYQSGGAIGFRDQLQDAVNLIFFDPEIAKKQILLSCSHQYLEGDVMHWWHSLPDGDKGVRTRCSDDLLWLVWALCEYVEKTGDVSICDSVVSYVNSSPLDAADSDRYEHPSESGVSESVLLHAERAVKCVLSRGRGLHGLLLFGSGDWNDGMNSVDGESVWLSWFFAHTVRRFSDLLMMLCKLEPDRYRALASELGSAAEEAWDGGWYLRGYWPDGSPLGGKSADCCRIDSVCQSWAAFCADASNSRTDLALDNAVEALYDRKARIVKLFTPPFLDCEKDPGYIASYGPGFRENGGQYTHAAIWLASACLKRGRIDDGVSILLDLLPENHDLSVYEAEPFVIAADVYSCPGHEGEAGWTWYTGSAGWYLRVVLEDLLGLQLWAGKLYVRPRLPDTFRPVRIRWHGREIVIDQEEILLDGEKYDGKGIPY